MDFHASANGSQLPFDFEQMRCAGNMLTLELWQSLTAEGLIHTNKHMHEKPELSDWWLMSGTGTPRSRWALTHKHTHSYSYTTSTSGTHSDVQKHIPPVGSWSWVRICEICQPMGDWVIEEFDSERNILLPWWWTRGNNARIQQQQRVSGEKRRLIINTDEQGDKSNRIFSERFELFKSPLQGSFFTRNSSRAIQPPPTRTITVLRKIRTRRSCWESPN